MDNADDFIVRFELESDARRYQSVLPKRLARFSLAVAEEKTKLLRFGRFARRDSQRLGEGAPSTFDFLGFTHYCGSSRSGRFKLKRKKSTKKLRMKLLDRDVSWGGCGVTCVGWEPDALTAHVRICEGANSIVQGSDIVTPPEETGGQQGTQTVS